MKSMVWYLKSVDVPQSRVVLITPPPLCEAAWEKECLAQGKRTWGLQENSGGALQPVGSVLRGL